MEKEEKIIFRFKFKDKLDKNITYFATFTPPNNLLISTRFIKQTTKYASEDIRLCTCRTCRAWKIFYTDASFDAILKAINLSDIPWDVIEHNLNNVDLIDDKIFLNFIREYPIVLMVEPVAKRLSLIIEKAKDGWLKERNEAKENLRDYLIPIHSGKEKIITPLKNPKHLLKMLASHISKKCKEEIKRQGWNVQEALINWDDTFDHLIKWGDRNEKRIFSLKNTKETLRKLLQNPSGYVDELLMSLLNIKIRKLKYKLK